MIIDNKLDFKKSNEKYKNNELVLIYVCIYF